jgi:branched-subunit amino acid aminotransferase/4-amino-4-deoxychorismate lyase
VLEVCEALRIPIVLQPPTLEQLQTGQMDGAFISSTSQLVMPIDKILLPDGTEKALEASRHPTQSWRKSATMYSKK